MSSALSVISVRGARTHNLKNIDLDLPRDKLIVFTGLSGSGKSSLAFDTLYAEGQRRYVESLSAYARQFLSMMEKPDVDHIEGLSPAISIEQKATSHNPRSTVGTVTEIHDYLRLLFARAGQPVCPKHNLPLSAQTVSEMVDRVMALPKESRVMLLAPVISDRKGEHQLVFAELVRNGFIRARVDGEVMDLDYPPTLDKNRKHTIEVVVDRLAIREGVEQRLAESFETALGLSEGTASVQGLENDEISEVFSSLFACPHCGFSIGKLEPRMFSFNNPAGACPTCDGLGQMEVFDSDLIVPDRDLTIGEGAIRGWDRSHWFFGVAQGVARYFDFDMELPWSKLSDKYREYLLYGVPSEDIRKAGPKAKKAYKARARWRGLITGMERHYRSTESGAVREALRKYMTAHPCTECHGTRLREESRHVLVGEHALSSISAMSIEDATETIKNLKLTGRRATIAQKILDEISARLQFLNNVGLNYLTLDRSAESLSGGEAQRIRLASQIGAGLVGVMYILDEPSIGLHQRDNARLLRTLTHLRDIGNTVIVVEHDEEAIRTADHIVDIGPGAGVHGGAIVTEGTYEEILRSSGSITAQYLDGRRSIPVPAIRTRGKSDKAVRITGACGNNLNNVSVEFPVGLFTCVTGVSGSGKSTLVNQTLYPVAARALNRASTGHSKPYQSISGLNSLDKVVEINQSPIGRTPRSNPATYTNLFTPIRELFSQTQESRARGYKPGRFSFNVKGGRCEACSGDGVIRVEMHFLPDVYVPCDICKGERYNRETLDVRYKGKNISQILDMTVEEAYEFFEPVPSIRNKLQTLMDVGLSYIKLGQNATTLSGGEAQRVKLSRELSRKATGNTLYILDEPTTGLHFHDIKQLLNVLLRLRDQGNTIIVIEHNLDVIKCADWIVDMGPEGGSAGGNVVASGSPEEVARHETSFTGRFLNPLLDEGPLRKRWLRSGIFTST